jgi:hypothetical protein
LLRLDPLGYTYADRVSIGKGPAMSEWFVKYLDLHTNRETESHRVDARDQAIILALDRERNHCAIRSIVGPSGEEQWAQVKPKT